MTETGDLAAILDDLHHTLTRYVAFPDDHAARAVALWIAATHALPAFEFAPRLVITSPQKRCGKTRLLDVIEYTAHNPIATVDATVPAVFRSLDRDHPPTLIIDEADAVFGSKKAAEQNEDLRKLLNAGHQRGRKALRCVGPLQIPTEFPTFAMAVLAGIGAMPDTITDRAVNVSMRRRAADERVSQFRSRRDGPALHVIGDLLAEWFTEAELAKLADAVPQIPAEDRAADTWEPLISIADRAGGRWPELARAACRAMVTRAVDADESANLGTLLLSDIRQVFTEHCASFLPSQQLVNALRAIDESPWGDFDLTRSKLAYRLRDFGIKTRHNGTASARGYRLEDFADAFQRYTRQEPSEPVNPQVERDSVPDVSSDNPSGTVRRNVNPSGTVRSAEPSTCDSDGLTVPDGSRAGFAPPSGPGRCDWCGWHVQTQGHKPDCPRD
jgi:hypothetical protein